MQLSEPFKIFEFDFWKRPDSRGETELQVKATSDGIVHAVVSWYDVHTLMIIMCSNLNIIFPSVDLEIVHTNNSFFCRWVLQLDCDGAIFYSTAPKWISSPLTEAPGQLTQLLPLFLMNHVPEYYQLIPL